MIDKKYPFDIEMSDSTKLAFDTVRIYISAQTTSNSHRRNLEKMVQELVEMVIEDTKNNMRRKK